MWHSKLLKPKLGAGKFPDRVNFVLHNLVFKSHRRISFERKTAEVTESASNEK